MSTPWAREPFGPVLKGLMNRWQERAEDALFARLATNVDFFGGVVGKRGGTQLVTGWGSYLLTNVTAVANVYPMADVGPGTLYGGYQIGDLVSIQETDTSPITIHTILTVDNTLHRITLVDPIDLAAGAYITVRRPIPDSPAIRGLFPALFRDGRQRLVAAAGGRWWRIFAGTDPQVITESYGFFVIASWDGNKAIPAVTGLSGIGPLGSIVHTLQGAKLGDHVRIPGAGTGGSELLTRIQEIRIEDSPTPGTLKVLFTDPVVEHPINAVATVYLPSPDPSVEEYGVMFANVLNLSSQALLTGGISPDPPVFYPPRKYVVNSFIDIIYRHGIIGPLSIPVYGPNGVSHYSGIAVVSFTPDSGPYPDDDPGPIGGTYRWRYAYRNTLTGQESLPSPIESLPFPPVTVPDGDVTNLAIPSSIDPQVDQIRIYRAGPGVGDVVGGDYRLAGTIVNDPLHVALLPFTDRMRPLTGRLLREGLDTPAPDEVEQFIPWVHANRLLALVQRKASQPGFILFSDQPDLEEGWLKGESFPSTNLIFVNHDDGDIYTACSVLFDSVVVFKRRSTWRILGVPPDLTIQPVHYQGTGTGIGCIAAKMVVQDHDELLFPHDDGYYQLSRFSGVQSGFVSDRLSLPIDRSFLAGQFLTGSLREKGHGHACFFRPGRQIRVWLDPERCFVFTFDGPLTGEPMGWAQWGITGERDGDLAEITASAVAPIALGITANWDPTDLQRMPTVVHYLGTSDGLVLQMDTGRSDFGGISFPVVYETVDFAPAGRGIAARGRALDLPITAYEKVSTVLAPLTALTLRVTTDQLVTPIDIGLTVVGGHPIPDTLLVSPFHLLGSDVLPVEAVAALFIAPGQYHRFRIAEQAQDTMWRLLGMNYWSQPITITQIRRPFRQSTLERLT